MDGFQDAQPTGGSSEGGKSVDSSTMNLDGREMGLASLFQLVGLSVPAY